LSPNTPQHDAGTRIEPPPSLPWATGTTRAATAAAEPPLDPPEVRVRSHGVFVGPNSSGSVTGNSPSSGAFVLPRMTIPAALWRRTISLSRSGTKSFKKRLLRRDGTPA
jgi:hypothetical protein